MLCLLPAVGLIPGALWALCARFGLFLPPLLRGFLLAVLPWAVTGFLHLDGFMDVCDAALSRRDLETRRRILKDSHCGAFAVICLVLLALLQLCVFASAQQIAWQGLLLAPVAGRAAAALAVSCLPALPGSQYKASALPTKLQRFALLLLLLLLCALPPCIWGLAGLAPLCAVLGYALSLLWAFLQLGGMSGDVSGFALSVCELCAAAAACFLR